MEFLASKFTLCLLIVGLAFGHLELSKMCSSDNGISGTAVTDTNVRSILDCARECYSNFQCHYIGFDGNTCVIYNNISQCGTTSGANSREVYKVETECEPDWYRYRGSCYYIATTKTTWSTNYCPTRDAELVTVNTAEEGMFIVDLLAYVNFTNIRVWLGATDAMEEGNWSWSSGQPWMFQNWLPGEPNDGLNGTQDCLTMYVSNGKWTDATCSIKKTAVCEKPVQFKDV